MKYEINLGKNALEDLFKDEKGRKTQEIVPMDIKELKPYAEQPFKVLLDNSMDELCASIEQYGVLSPIIVRPHSEGGYEVLSGHRRMKACELLGIEEVPVVVKDLDDDTAAILLVDSNLQRENILPSEKAFAYKLKLEAMKRKAGRPSKDNCTPSEHNFEGKRTVEIIGDENGESKEQIRRFIRLNELTPELLEFVDEGKIGMRPAVELSYLQEDEMRDLVDFIDDEEVFPSHAQTIRMKALSKEGKLDTEAIRDIMLEEKPNQKAKIKIPMERIEKYFPSGTSQQQMEDTIVKALAMYRQRQKENRDAR